MSLENPYRSSSTPQHQERQKLGIAALLSLSIVAAQVCFGAISAATLIKALQYGDLSPLAFVLIILAYFALLAGGALLFFQRQISAVAFGLAAVFSLIAYASWRQTSLMSCICISIIALISVLLSKTNRAKV